MTVTYSLFLAGFLNIKEALPKNPEVKLQSLCDALAESFTDNQHVARLLLKADGKLHLQELVGLVVNTTSHDYVVRDLVTSGHLAKVLCRVRRCGSSIDFNILGLPNKIFDERSSQERAAHLATSRGFGSILTNESVKVARMIVEEEARLMTSDEP